MSESHSLPTEPEGMVAALLERFNSGKVSAMMGLYAPEAVFIAKDGRTITDHTEIAAELERDPNSACRWRPRRAMCSLPAISPRSCWTGQLMAQVPTASTCTSEARQAMSCAAARMDSGGTRSTIIKGRQCDSPPDICAPRLLSAMEPLFT
jgi:hypothetical protein